MSLAAGCHPNLVGVVGAGGAHLRHPGAGDGADPPRIMSTWRGRPAWTPAPGMSIRPGCASPRACSAWRRAWCRTASAWRGIPHGDLYAHNLLHSVQAKLGQEQAQGRVLLGDGAASCYDRPMRRWPARLERLEVRAFRLPAGGAAGAQHRQGRGAGRLGSWSGRFPCRAVPTPLAFAPLPSGFNAVAPPGGRRAGLAWSEAPGIHPWPRISHQTGALAAWSPSAFGAGRGDKACAVSGEVVILMHHCR